MKQVFNLLIATGALFAGNAYSAELCEVDLARPNGDVLMTFYGEDADVRDACFDAVASCKNAQNAAVAAEVVDLRFFDAKCKILTDLGEPEIPDPTIIDPGASVSKDSFEMICDGTFPNFGKTCFISDAYQYPEFRAWVEVQDVTLIEDNGRCNGRWELDYYGEEISNIKVKSGCEATFKVDYTYKGIRIPR